MKNRRRKKIWQYTNGPTTEEKKNHTSSVLTPFKEPYRQRQRHRVKDIHTHLTWPIWNVWFCSRQHIYVLFMVNHGCTPNTQNTNDFSHHRYWIDRYFKGFWDGHVVHTRHSCNVYSSYYFCLASILLRKLNSTTAFNVASPCIILLLLVVVYFLFSFFFSLLASFICSSVSA